MKKSDLILRSKRFAEQSHQGQFRKLNSEPFMNHPNNVAEILEEAGFRPEVVAAGYLHDVVEDTDVPIENITEIFGEEISHFVAANTENKALPWKERKEQTINQARIGSIEVKALIAADKFDNLTNVMKYLKEYGDEVWSVFVKGKEQQYWYYSSISAALYENIDYSLIPPFFQQYQKLVKELKDIVTDNS